MTPYLFLLLFGSGLLFALVRHPIYGLYAYFLTFYLAPQDMWWRNDVPDIRYLLIAAVVTAIATLRLPADKNRTPFLKLPPVQLLLAFVIYVWLQTGWAIGVKDQIDLAFLLTKHFAVFYLIYRLADSPERIWTIALVHLVGCAWFGYQALGASGGRLETIGGAVATSNKLGIHVATALLFGGLMFLTQSGVRRWLPFACVPLIANTLVMTISRGAFLGFFCGGIAGFIAIPKRYRKGYILCGVLAIILVVMLAHDGLVERFSETWRAVTTQEQELDRSASSRKDIFRAGIAIGLEHPFGAGAKATERLSQPYVPYYDHGRAAHNTVAEIFAEQGFPGLILYLLMVWWAARTTLRIRREYHSGEAASTEIAVMGAMVGAALAAIYVAGNFTTNLELETQYWCLALLASIAALQEASKSPVDEKEGAVGGETPPPSSRRTAIRQSDTPDNVRRTRPPRFNPGNRRHLSRPK
ncbi:MAG: O-antigen ligase family protein [Pseudomonadota bacterium]